MIENKTISFKFIKWRKRLMKASEGLIAIRLAKKKTIFSFQRNDKKEMSEKVFCLKLGEVK